MTSEELYEILNNFGEQNLHRLGFEEKDGFWMHPNSTRRFQVSDKRLYVYINELNVGRLNAAFNDPVKLYQTFIETEILPTETHFQFLREQGLEV